MRAHRLLGLLLVVGVTGLLSGGAAGAAPTTSAVVAAVAGPAPAALDPAAAPAPAAPVAASRVAAPPAMAAPVVAAPVVAAPVARRVAGTPCVSSARACIELSSNRAWLIRDGVVRYGPVPITHGRAGWRTPPGTFRVTIKDRYHRSRLFDNAPMPYSVFFNGGIAFHQGSLRIPSHGCIHLSGAAAQTFFGALSRGDVVQVVR